MTEEQKLDQLQEEQYYAERIRKRREKKGKLLGAALASLLDEEDAPLWLGSNSDESKDNAVYVVRKIASHFHMDASLIALPAEIMQQLQGLALLKRLLRKSGIQIRKVSLKEQWYTKDNGVIIAQYRDDFVALVPEKPGQYAMYNLQLTSGEAVHEENAAEFSEEGYLCYAALPQGKLGLKDLLSFVYRQCWKVDWRTIVLVSFVAGLLPLLTPIITKTIFSDAIPLGDRQGLATITQIMMVAGFTTATLSLVRAIAVLRITGHVDMAAEAALWGRLLSLPISFFRKYQTGELLKRMSGVDAVKELLSGELVSGIFNTVFSFWSILLMGYYSIRLTLMALLVWFVYLLITAFIYRRVYSYKKQAVEAFNRTSGQVLQLFNGLTKFRVQGYEEQAFYMWAQCFSEERKWNLKLRWQQNYSTLINTVQPLLLNIALFYTVVHWLNGTVLTGGESGITYAEFIGFNAAFASFNTTLIAMIPLVVKFYSIKPYLENLTPILETEPETLDNKVEAGKLTGAINIEHVSFAYNDGPEVLHDINLHIAAGEAVAIVGSSGCGKSTLVRLLLGFEKPNRGAIFYDEYNLHDVNLPSVRSQMGVVLQNGQLMPGNILTNIVGTLPMTLEDAWAAAERVGLADDIRQMPMQMYTAISEGSGNISGGQRQRIMLARSIVNNPRILLLDEATSSLDNITQMIFTRSLEKMGCTKVIVAHRLSTIKNVDRIIVMDAGRIVEEGSYDALLAQDGLFARLAQRQLV